MGVVSEARDNGISVEDYVSSQATSVVQVSIDASSSEETAEVVCTDLAGNELARVYMEWEATPMVLRQEIATQRVGSNSLKLIAFLTGELVDLQAENCTHWRIRNK